MRVGRKFLFYALVRAVVAPMTPFESVCARIFVAAGWMWYSPRGSNALVSIYDEPEGDADEACDERVDEDGDAAEDDNEALFKEAAAGGLEDEEEAAGGVDGQVRVAGGRPKPPSCTLLLRDAEGLVPLLHPGQYVSVTLVRGGAYERTTTGRVREKSAAAPTLDFHQHIYDVTRCCSTSTKTHREIELHTLRGALGQPDPLSLVEQSRQRSIRARENAASSASEGAARRRGAYVSRGNLYKEIDAAFHSHRSSMSWLGGLIAALPISVRTSALLAFTPFYQAHSAAYGPYENIGALLAHVRAPAREVCLWSASELQCIAHYEHSRRLTTIERLFFGALVGRIPLSEYEHAVGRWRGVYYKEPAAGSRDESARALARWTRVVCDLLHLQKRPLSAVARSIGYVAWALYDASATLLSERAGAPDASTVLLVSDVLAYVAARRRRDHRFADQACLDSAIKVLTEIGVWRRAPDDTVVRLAVARQRAGRASDYFSEPPSDRSLHAAVLLTRAYDVSERLAQCVFGAQLRFCDTATFHADSLPLGGRTTFLYYSVRPNVPDRGVRFVALPRLLEREREDAAASTDFRLTAFTSDAIVLLDAHMFTEVQLLRLLLLVANLGGDEHRAAPRQLFAVGDTHVCSPFATLALTAAQHPRAERYARDRLRADAHSLQRAIYDATDTAPLVPLLAQQLHRAVASPPWKLEPGDANVQRRWILVAHTHAAASSALSWLARSIVDNDADDKIDISVLDHRTSCMHETLLELAQRPRLLESTLLLAAPWVGYRGRCIRVLRVLAEVRPRTRLDETILESACLSIDASSLTQAVSLDSDLLLLEVTPDAHTADYEDHRLCCATWAPNVLSVAVHRAHLCSQSLPLARDALPCDSRLTSGTALLLTSDYTLDTLYAAAVRATYYARTIVAVAAPDAQPPETALARRLPLSRTCVGDLYGSMLNSLP